MLGIHHLLRAKRWVQNPPSPRMFKFVMALVAVAAMVVGLEWLGLWPDWAQAERLPRGIIR